MKFDVYKVSEDKVLVYKRGEIDECGELPEGKPLYESTADGEWRDWCDERSDWRDEDSIRVCEPVGTYAASFADDLKDKAQRILDRYREEGKDAGWGDLEIDRSGMSYTYRRSAAWKDDPTYYTFQQSLKWTRGNDDALAGFALRARDNLVMLWGMAEAAYELGISIVFDDAFKIHIFGVSVTWRATFD